MQYFEHSTSSTCDTKLTQLCIECGCGAVAAYWVMLEQMYRDETGLVVFENQAGNRPITKVVSHWLNVTEEQLSEWISAMLDLGLFHNGGDGSGEVVSERAMENIAAYHKKVEIARQNGKRGGRKPKQKPTGNRVGSYVGTDAETQSKANKTKQNKGIALDKQEQIPSASSVAAAAVAAPLAAKRKLKPPCPLCGTPMKRNGQTAKWDCPNCMDSFTDSKLEELSA